MNQDWKLRGGNGKSPDTAKLQGHLALSMSNNLGMPWFLGWISLNPPLRSWPVWLSTSELTIFLSPFHCEQPLTTYSFQIRLCCGLLAQYTPPCQDTIPNFEMRLQTPKVKWVSKKENTQKPSSDLSSCGMKHNQTRVKPCWIKQNISQMKSCFESPKFELFVVLLCAPRVW